MIKEKYSQVNSPNVIYEIFDDEVVLINLDSGNYYSIDAVAVNIWERIGTGTKVRGIAEGISQAYQGDRKAIEQVVYQFVEELHQEGLIRLLDVEEIRGDLQPEAESTVADDAQKPEFEAPVLARYTDMQDLLLLDPIHEVDDTGWPNIKHDPNLDE